MRLMAAAKLPLYLFGLLLALPVFITMAAIPGFWTKLINDNNFLPHSTCYLQNKQMVALHASSDFLIGLAYTGISISLGWLIYKARKDIPFQWMFGAFGVFIIACGITHFMEVWTVWRPYYWLAGLIKAITAAASVATAVALPFLFPKVFGLIQLAKASESRRIELERANGELERLYEKVKELDAVKNRFFANVSHELRTPLTLVLGSADRIRNTPAAAAVRHDAEAIKRNGLLVLRHVNDLLDASKLDAGRMRMAWQQTDAASLIRLVASNFESVAGEKNIQFTVHAPGALAGELDPEKIERVLLNLLSNAFKFTPNGGRIDLEIEEQQGSLGVTVQDNGPGLPKEFLPRAFQRFQQADSGDTRRQGGTGLGLSIAKELVELHGGAIAVTNVEPHGARFEFTIPLRAPEGVEVAGPSPAPRAKQRAVEALAELSAPVMGPLPEGPENGPLVLVAEDNAEMRQFVAETLAATCRIVTAANGAEALRKLEERTPDLLVSDLMMPEMSGEQLLREVRARAQWSEMPVVLLSAKAEDDLRARLLQSGANDYLIKPFFAEELRARVANLISLKQARENLQDANRQLDEFNASVSHDLRAPLRGIASFAGLLREGEGKTLSPDAQKYLARIMENAARMSRLLEDLLAYSRVTRMELEIGRVNLQELFAQVKSGMEAQIEETGAKVRQEGELPEVMGNSTVLSQALMNLLGNALKYVAPGVKPEVKVYAERRGANIRVIVEDNGLGIEQKYHEKIFKPFERLHSGAHYSGTGLGLALVSKGIERLGGRVGLESEPANGSRFWFELPQPPK